MARVNILKLCKSISQESVSDAPTGDINVDVKKDLPDQVQEDTEAVQTNKDVSAAVTETKTSEPGPENGGGNGTAQTVDVKKVGAAVDAKDLNVNEDDQLLGDANREAFGKIKPNDDNVAKTTSVEEHDKADSLKTIETGEAESVETPDEMIIDLDESTQKLEVDGLGSKIEEQGKICEAVNEDIASIEHAIYTTQQYGKILDSLDRKGAVMSSELRMAMRVGLEAIDSDFFSDVFVSNEDSFPTTQRAAGAEGKSGTVEEDDGDGHEAGASKGKLSGKLKKLWEALKRAFFRSITALQDLYQAWVGNTTKIEAKIKELENAARSLEGGVKYKLANATRLYSGDTYVGDSPAAVALVNKTATALLIDWTSTIADLLETYKVKNSMIFGNNMDVSEIIAKVGTILDNGFRSLPSLNPSDKAKVPSGLLDAKRLHWSGALPGNRALYVGVSESDEKGIKGAIQDARHFSKNVIINFSAMPEQSTHVADKELSTMSGSEAMSVLKELRKLLQLVAGYKEGMVEFNKLRKQVSTDSANDFFNGSFITGDSNSALGGFMMMSMASETTTSQQLFLGYLISMMKAFLANIEANIATENGEDKVV